jgi:hypothetical protein
MVQHLSSQIGTRNHDLSQVPLKRKPLDWSISMPRSLHRYYGAQDLHFIPCSCYRRQPHLDTPRRRDLLEILEQVRKRYGFVVLGYVVMPEHFHLHTVTLFDVLSCWPTARS